MKLKLYRSATIGIISEDFKLLKDPWLTDGEYFGSWYHFPPFDFKKNLKEINSYNAIYISHIHPDHCSEETLKKINKNIPIYIHSYHKKFLKFKIERLGFKVIELEHGKEKKLSKNFSINIFAADNCNPELCYKFTGCADFSNKKKSQQIDTLCIIKTKKINFLNVNDCIYSLAKSVFNLIKKKYYKIDCLLTGYGGAGPYPQCFKNLNDLEKIKEANKKKFDFLNQAYNYIEYFKPKYYLPFAGTYLLSGKLANLNKFRGMPTIDETYTYIDRKILDNKLSNTTTPIKLNPGATFNFETKKLSKKYKPILLKEMNNYIKKNLTKKKFIYENEKITNDKEIFDLAVKAHKNFINKQKELNINLNTDIFISFGKKFIKINKKRGPLEITNIKNLKNSSGYVLYILDKRLLKNLLMGPKKAHWNNAEIGSHITFYRKPDIFERNLYSSMNYLHL